MKNILTDRIDYLNFEDGETVRSTHIIRNQTLSLYIYIFFHFHNIVWGRIRSVQVESYKQMKNQLCMFLTLHITETLLP
jgi:hypothetical protein